MRKVFLLIYIFILVTVIEAAEIAINPQSGAFGVDLGSGKYNITTDLFIGESDGSLNNTSINSPTYNPSQGYTKDHMIAIGGIWNLANGHDWGTPDDRHYLTQDIYVNVICHGGLYFQSQSAEGARRPFYLVLLPKIRANYDQDTFTHEPIIIESSDSNKSFSFDDYPSGGLVIRDDAWTIWFDVVLVLPYWGYENSYIERPVSDTGVLIDDKGQSFQLVQADDYTAIVEITVSTSGLPPASITIPFSGYYSNIEEGKKDAVANLYVAPKARASNLSIERDYGKDISVADISFMSTTGRDGSLNPDFRIFLSSSNDPNENTADEFLLVHEDVVSRQDPVIGKNAIGYTATLTPTTETIGYMNALPGPVSSSGGTRVSFSGTSYCSGNEVIGEWTKVGRNQNTDTGSEVVYFMYEGDLSVNIDQPPTEPMESGRYTSEIFIHVVDLGV